MERAAFLRRLGFGAAATLMLPKIIKAETVGDENKVAIDINSISNFSEGSRKMSAHDILLFYHETGVLIYDSRYGEKPSVINGEIKVIDAAEYK